ncbi:MAG: cation-transporting P-type ATPase, partial [Candidatus Omnitrophica bacterium]|nr:cation-transporting P-type ATPase [Candidatus Omnitrophota bacterium]
MNTEEAKQVSVEEIFRKFSSSKTGLSSQEAQKRLEENGPNEISEKKISPLLKFLGYFWGPIPWMIET